MHISASRQMHVTHACSYTLCKSCSWLPRQVAANNIRPVVPHLSWAAQPSSCSFQAQQQQEPLQFLADALSVCSDQELHPIEALALLLSAASVPTAAARGASSHALVQAGSSGRSMSGAAAAALEGQVRAACSGTQHLLLHRTASCDVHVTGQNDATWLASRVDSFVAP